MDSDRFGAVVRLAFDFGDGPAAPAKLVVVVGSVLRLMLERQRSRL